jgi:hypothetical protein
MVTDKMVPRNVYEKFFTIRLPDRSGWEKWFEPRKMGAPSSVVVQFKNSGGQVVYFEIYKVCPGIPYLPLLYSSCGLLMMMFLFQVVWAPVSL